MKAVVHTEYGSPDVLMLKEVEKTTPKDNEILIRNYATTVGFGDITARNFKNIPPHKFTMPGPLWLVSRMAFGFNKPAKTILGSEFAGVVEATGKNVKLFHRGDQVFGYTGANFGACAEYLCVPEDGMVALKPANMPYEEACTIPYGGLMALSLLQKANLQPGQKALIIGASGGIGSAAVQLARHFGVHVTGVCSTAGLEYAKALGADQVIDYTREDFASMGETYDLILDVPGKSSFAHCKAALKPNGIYLHVSFKMKQLFQMLWTKIIGGPRIVCTLASETIANLKLIQKLIEAGEIKAIIDKQFQLEQTDEAHRYVEAGHKAGSVVITIP